MTQDDRLVGCRQEHELNGFPVASGQEHVYGVCLGSYPPQHVSIQGSGRDRRARDRSMMLSSAPESTRAVMGWGPEGNRNSPERMGLDGGAVTVAELTSMFPLTWGLCPFAGHWLMK